MNLKEAFRYQNFLAELESLALNRLGKLDLSFTETLYHKRKEANPEAEDMIEVIVPEGDFYATDDILEVIRWVIEEKERLSVAIAKAKATLPYDMDAVINSNKSRHVVTRYLKQLLSRKPACVKSTNGMAYKLNAEGNQVAYRYDIERTTADNFNRNGTKEMLMSLSETADKVSSEIDHAMVNVLVDYEPLFSVNESFDDVVRYFVPQISA